jgi:hypothetical protein
LEITNFRGVKRIVPHRFEERLKETTKILSVAMPSVRDYGLIIELILLLINSFNVLF